MKEKKEMAIGIDFGITYSIIATIINNKVIIIPNEIGDRKTPSKVIFSGDQIYIGEETFNTLRNSMLYTSILVLKSMIGAGILNLPLIFKTSGILGGIILTIFINFILFFVAYFLGRSKDLSQRYSYTVYSKIVLGTTGTVIMKIALVIMCAI